MGSPVVSVFCVPVFRCSGDSVSGDPVIRCSGDSAIRRFGDPAPVERMSVDRVPVIS